MLKVIAPVLAVFALLALATTGGSALTANNDRLKGPGGLTVHEWGTFTTVAGPDGLAVDWLPLGGPYDLPCFVDHFANPLFKYSRSLGAILSYQEARSRLRGKVRMETPVLYFYSPRDENVNVKVDFPGGLITEWYPPGNVSQPVVQDKSLIESAAGSRIEWKNVTVLPGITPNLPFEDRPSHYYTARETDAAPVRVNGKDEKFLFYRGVGSFPVPLTAKVTPSGNILVETMGSETIPAVILFENRGGKIGYRIHREFQGEITLDAPSPDGNFASLQRELEKTLSAQGLYTKEAHAMVETWRDSWFEEGTRIFYIVPRRVVDTILPLRMDPPPAPNHIVRAFVGRVEIITPVTVQAVEGAIAANDVATLAKYGRFLGPITERMDATPRVRAVVDSAYKSFLGEVSRGCK